MPINVARGTAAVDLESVSMVFSNAGSAFNKTGAGIFRITNTNNTALFQVSGGTMEMNGSTSGTITVNSGGTLIGTSVGTGRRNYCQCRRQSGRRRSGQPDRHVDRDGQHHHQSERFAADRGQQPQPEQPTQSDRSHDRAKPESGSGKYIRHRRSSAIRRIRSCTATLHDYTRKRRHVWEHSIEQCFSADGTTIASTNYVLSSPSFSAFNAVSLDVVDGFGTSSLVLQFTPVPEPATVLGLAALGLAGAGSPPAVPLEECGCVSSR